MKVKEAIETYHQKVDQVKNEQKARAKLAMKQKLQTLDQQRTLMNLEHERTLLELNSALQKGEIKKPFLKTQKTALQAQKEQFEKQAAEAIKNQEELNRKNEKKLNELIGKNIRDQIFNQLIKECVGKNNLVTKSFQGIPAHVQRFNKRWQLISREIDADPDRFSKFIESERSGVMLWQWKRWDNLRTCKRFLKSRAAAGDQEAVEVLASLKGKTAYTTR